MLQEIELEDALKKFLQGKKVLVMYDESLKAEGTTFMVEALEAMLKGNRYLVDVPAVENPDFKQAVVEMAKPDKKPPKSLKRSWQTCRRIKASWMSTRVKSYRC